MVTVDFANNKVSADFTQGDYLFDIPEKWKIIDYDNTQVLVSDVAGVSSGKAQFSITLNCSHFEVDYNIDSESGYDYMYIYVDNSQKVKVSGQNKQKTTYKVDLTSGDHVIKFVYSKDSSGNKGRDRAEIYAIRYTTEGLRTYSIKDNGTEYGVPNTVTDDTDINNITLVASGDSSFKYMSSAILNKVLTKSSLFSGNNVDIVLHSSAPIKYVKDTVVIKGKKIVPKQKVEMKNFNEITDSSITGISSIVIEGACDNSSILKFIIIFFLF